ncbi:MAG TPA: dTDP-4-dehydrorhamnose 3,5-epimerase [Fibrobacteria bacterium]|nr:dTDP-4-dehydrorhamnose 3,5-epimerase [Fibrobacteria bacterium]
MSLIVERTPIEGLLVVKPKVHRDARGFFVESYNRDTFAQAGIATTFVQDNHSKSSQGTLRGLHFQTHPGQAKLIRCTRGLIWDVAVDIRPDSSTFGRHFAVELGPDDCAMLYIPVGFAHGFVVLSEEAEVQYKCSNVYVAATEAGLAWDDPDLNVPWPLDRLGGASLLSERDKANQSFAEWKKLVGA